MNYEPFIKACQELYRLFDDKGQGKTGSLAEFLKSHGVGQPNYIAKYMRDNGLVETNIQADRTAVNYWAANHGMQNPRREWASRHYDEALKYAAAKKRKTESDKKLSELTEKIVKLEKLTEDQKELTAMLDTKYSNLCADHAGLIEENKMLRALLKMYL